MYSGNGFIQQSGRQDMDGSTYTSGRQRLGGQGLGKYLLKSKSPNNRAVQL